MTDRWNPDVVERPVEKPTNKLVLVERGEASGDLNSQHRVTTHPAGFRVRERGEIDGTVVHQYRCPVHGVFDASVERSSVPNQFHCPQRSDRSRCSLISPWAGSQAGQGWSSGECQS